jgi:hypothetical protein
MATGRVFVVTCLLLLTPLFPAVFLARSPLGLGMLRAQDEMNFTLEGKITEKSASKLTVSSGENIIFHVVYNDKTEIKKKDGSATTAQDLHTGLTISVAGDLAESGEITAKKIEIEGDESGK